MPRFILRYANSGPAPDAHVKQIRALPKAKIIDASSRMMLVDAPEEDLRKAIADMPGWVISAEQTINVPDPRPKVLHPPDDAES
jgi:hypothetical protein